MKSTQLFVVFICLAALRSVIGAETAMTELADLPEAKVVKTFDDFPNYDSRSAFVSTDGSALISLSVKRGPQGAETEVFQWNIADGKIVQSVAHPATGISEASLSANGRVLVLGFIDKGVLACDLKNDQSIELRPHEKSLGCVAVSHDGKKIATVGMFDKIVKETSLSVKQKHPSRIVLKLEPRSQCSSLAYSPDGNLLVGGIMPGAVVVWDAKTLKKKWEQKAHSKAIQIVFTPDSRKIITVEYNTKIVLWDARTGTEQAVMQADGLPMQRACMSPSGKMLATLGTEQGSGKQIAIVWDLESRKGILRYTLTEEQRQAMPTANMSKPGNIAFLPDESGLVIFGKKPFVIGLAP